MNDWVSAFGFSAVDEETYKKQMAATEPAAPTTTAEKDDLTALEKRIEKKLDSLQSLEKKVDKLITMAYASDVGLEERKLYADGLANQKVQALAEIIMPLLNSLYRTENQRYIDWPGRGPIIKTQTEKVEAILNGKFFED